MKKIITYTIPVLALVSSLSFAGKFEIGYCTYGVDSIKGETIPWTGNGDKWYANAEKYAKDNKNSGIEVSKTTPKVGAIVVYDSMHVAVVSEIKNGTVTKVIDMNGGNDKCGAYDSKTYKCSDTFGKFVENSPNTKPKVIGYIYYKLDKVCPPSNSTILGTLTSCSSSSNLLVKCSPTTLNESGTNNTSICAATVSGKAETVTWSITAGEKAASIDTKGKVTALPINADTAVTVKATSKTSNITTNLKVLNSSPQNGDNPLIDINSVCVADKNSLASIDQDSIKLELRHSTACNASWARFTNSGKATNVKAKVTLGNVSYNLVPGNNWTYLVIDKDSKAKASASYSYPVTKNKTTTLESRTISDISKK